MIKIGKTVTMSPEQWDIVIEGMRNPKNSWDRSDSYATYIEDPETLQMASFEFFVGPNDEKLMTTLREAGRDHRKYMRMMPVWVNITAPLYWWKEFDTYKVGTVENSCSTMHKIADKEFELADFSCDQLLELGNNGAGFVYDCMVRTGNDVEKGSCCLASLELIELTIDVLNTYRHRFIKTGNKEYWWQMIQLLPSSYNQKRTVMLNYEVLANMYHSRRNHKLDEWHDFCDWIESLPYSELITGKFAVKED